MSRVTKPVILEKHNPENQLFFGDSGYSDTRDLEIGKCYDVEVETPNRRTRYYIGEKYYDSACFKDLTAADYEKMSHTLKTIKDTQKTIGGIVHDWAM